MMQGDVVALAVVFIEAVKIEDEETVRRVLSSPLAAQVAVEVAAMCGKSRTDAALADQQVRRLARFESDLAKAGAANRRLLKEKAELVSRLSAYRKGKAA